MLIEVDATAQLSPFLIRLADLAASPAEVGLVAELAAASGRPHLVTQVGRFAAYYGHVNEAAAFPIPDIAGLVRPPPGEPEAALLLGVARQESVFNPWVASHAGAQGLLQLMPRTAYLMARSLAPALQRGPADRRPGLQHPPRQPLPEDPAGALRRRDRARRGRLQRRAVAGRRMAAACTAIRAAATATT